MIKDMIRAFPLTLEYKINSLLDGAEPKDTKAFHLYKRCQFEGLWNEDFKKFSTIIEEFYSLAPSQRSKSYLDKYLDRPLHASLYPEFNLNFRTASVDETELKEITSWAHHLLRVHFKEPLHIFSKDVLKSALTRIIEPKFDEKDSQIGFLDFCDRWKESINKFFGNSLDQDFQHVQKELMWHYEQNKLELQQVSKTKFVPTIYLTQTEIDWVDAVKKSTTENLEIPDFPLSRGPEKQRLKDLERTISLYRIIQKSKSADFQHHRSNIRTTILDRCAGLLADCAR